MGRVLCYCLVVEEAEVRRAIRQGARTVEEVAARCEAGNGCGSCRGTIACMIDDEARRRAGNPDASEVLAQLGLFAPGKPG
jgi:bacterioferritin-associated ferredoxin